MQKTVAKQFFQYGVGAIVSALFSFASVLILTHIVNPASYGQGGLFIVFVSFLFMICNCGLDQSFVRFYYSSDKVIDRNRLFKRCMILVTIFSIFVIVLSFFLRSYLHLIFHKLFGGFLLYLSLTLLLTVASRFLLLVFRMEEKPLTYSIGQISNSFFYVLTILVLYFIFNIKGVHLIVLSYLSGLFFSTMILFVLKNHFFKLEGSQKKGGNLSSDYSFNNLITYGYPFIFTFVLVWCFQSLDRFILLKYSTYHELGIYSAAFSLIAPLVMMQTVFTTLWVPISVKRINGPECGMASFYSKAFSSILPIMLLCMTAFLSIKDILIHLLGAKYSQASSILPWLLFIPFFYILSQICIVGIIKSKKTYLNIPISMLTVLVNVVSCVLLIPAYGARGAAISIALTYGVFFATGLVVSFSIFKFDIKYWKLVFSIVLLLCVVSMPDGYVQISSLICFILYLCIFNNEIRLLVTELLDKRISAKSTLVE